MHYFYIYAHICSSQFNGEVFRTKRLNQFFIYAENENEINFLVCRM